MIILLDSDNSQNVKFHARSLSTGSATSVFVDETENTSTTDSVTLFTDRFYTYFDQAIPELQEDRHYMLTVTASGVEIFKGKVFVTNQTIEDYSINDTEFNERSTTNEYIYV